jgi:4-aminobutyrate aminotransferase-like enzyme
MYEHPLHIVRGEGAWLIDPDGRRYLDVYNNVASLGHCHPAVTEAICAQARTLATNTRYLHDTILELAERLLATVPGTGLAHLMLTCSGSEANDLAYRIAQVRTGGTGVIVTDTAYHGFTDAVSKFSPSLGASVDLGAHVRLVPAPRLYHAEGADLAERFTRDVEAAIADLRRHGIRPAALIVDSVFTSDGILPEPAGFLKGAVDAIQRAGGLFIADEVQPGFGRTGEHMWGFQRHGVIPDIVTLGKPMGNGQPVAGLLATADALAAFGKNSRYFNTFAGNTVSCAAALAVLDTIEREGLVRHAAMVGKLLRDGIADLARRHEAIGDVRGVGMFVGVELVSDRASRTPDREFTTRVVNRMRDKGVLLSACAMGHNVLKIRPPLVLSTDQAGMVIDVLDEALTAARSSMRSDRDRH